MPSEGVFYGVADVRLPSGTTVDDFLGALPSEVSGVVRFILAHDEGGDVEKIAISETGSVSDSELRLQEYLHEFDQYFGSVIAKSRDETTSSGAGTIGVYGQILVPRKDGGQDVKASGLEQVAESTISAMRNNPLLKVIVMILVLIPDSCPEAQLHRGLADIAEMLRNAPEAQQQTGHGPPQRLGRAEFFGFVGLVTSHLKDKESAQVLVDQARVAKESAVDLFLPSTRARAGSGYEGQETSGAAGGEARADDLQVFDAFGR